MSFSDLYVLSSPAAWLLWFVVLTVAMYFARLPAHRTMPRWRARCTGRCG